MKEEGRELDAAIARGVFGWTCIHEPRRLTREEYVADARRQFEDDYGEPPPDAWEGDYAWHVEESDYPPKVCAKCGITNADPTLHRRLPNYSTDIAAAWLIVDETTRNRDWRWQICTVRGVTQVWLVPVWHAATEADLRAQPDYMVDHETAPGAICRAALAALSSQSPQHADGGLG